MEKFKGKIIISDVDGTYTGSPEGTRKNREAIKYFKDNGGLFTFASGRAEYTIESVVPEFFELVNAPAVFANGSYLYDAEKKLRINEICVDGAFSKKLLLYINERIPEAKIRINRKEGYLVPDKGVYQELKDYFFNMEVCPLADMPEDGWNKIVFAAPGDVLERVARLVREYAPGRYAMTLSCPTLLELLDPEATKGRQIKHLKKLLGEKWTTYCCGDYENDEDMLKSADISVAPSSGMEKIVKMADIVTCPCSEGTIAYLVERIERDLKNENIG